MQYFLKNKFGEFKQISTLLFSHIIFFAFHKTNARLYKTKRAKHKNKNPPAIAEGFLCKDPRLREDDILATSSSG